MQISHTLSDKTSVCPAMVRAEYETTLYISKATINVPMKKDKGIDHKSVLGIKWVAPAKAIPTNILMIEAMRHRDLTPSTNCRLVTSRNKACMQNK
jgi:hypothetical protein